MNKTKDEVATQTALTVAELKKMGDMLANVRETIELYNHALNITRAPIELERGEFVAQYYALHSLTNTMYSKNQKIMNELDDIGYTLTENDNALEVENIRKKFN